MSPEKLLRFLKSVQIPLLWSGAAWISFSLMGYGLALRSFSDGAFQSIHINDVGPTDGQVEWVDAFAPRVFGIWFRIQRLPMTFYIPSEYISSEESWAELSRSLAPGKPVWFKATPNDNTVIQMTVNFKTPSEKAVILYDHVARIRPSLPAVTRERGSQFLVAGLLILPIFGAGWAGIRRLLRPAPESAGKSVATS